MCRLLSYLGVRTSIDSFLYLTDNSLIKQTYRPLMMDFMQMLNLAGFGMSVWNKDSFLPYEPYIYKTTQLPFFDKNLKSLAMKLRADCFIAHIRGVVFDTNEVVTYNNVHPFIFPGHTLVLAHNGTLTGIAELKRDLLNLIKPEISMHITGTTDSELIYALFLSKFEHIDDEADIEKVADAVVNTFKDLRKLRKKHGININSPLNLYISNGEFLVATRFAFDFGVFAKNTNSAHMAYHSMWYTFGNEYVKSLEDGYQMSPGARESIILASEPLTKNTTTWLEVPEYSLIKVWRTKKEVKFLTQDLDV